MYSLMHRSGPGRLATREGPSLAAALIIAEVAFKFRSFTLECVAFLATWFALSWMQEKLARSGAAKSR